MRFYINPGTTMTKAANLLGLFLLLASTTSLMAQPAAADSATDEAVRRQAAIITGLNSDGTVALKVFARTRTYDLPSVVYSQTPARWRWSWPPRV